MRLISRVLRQEVEQHLVKGWTPDLIAGVGRTALQNNVERTSRSVSLRRVPDKTAPSSRRALHSVLAPLPKHLRRSVTHDNGTENAEQDQINKDLGMQSCFCEPYRTWEKATVENLNRDSPVGTGLLSTES